MGSFEKNTAAILALEVTVATGGWREAVVAPEEVAAVPSKKAPKRLRDSSKLRPSPPMSVDR